VTSHVSTLGPVAAIVPCQNEAGSIAELVDELFRIGVSKIVVALDPKSSDDTELVATRHGAVVVTSEVSGYDGPVLAGIVGLGDFAGWVLFLDAGGKYEMDSIGSLISTADRTADMTFGIRNDHLFWHQRIGNNLFKAVLWLRFNRHVTKDVSSVRLIRSDVLPKLQLEDRQFSLPFQTLVHGLKQGMRIDYLPIRSNPRQDGTSKVSGSPRNSARAALQMVLSIRKAPDFTKH
jgi:glycosyltransferase involved in cell wall biosynthesis